MIWLILLLSLFLRVVNLRQSFWLDEAISAIAARDFTYPGIVFDFTLNDFHPPLYYLILKFWAILFGFSEVSLRMLSVLFGVATVYIVYLCAKKITGQKRILADVSSLFLATSPLHIYYSQEVRMYSMICFVSALSALLLLRLEEGQTKLRWLLFSLSLILLLATDYITILMLPVFGLYVLYKGPKKLIINFLTSLIPLILVFYFWFPIYKIQSEGGSLLLKVLPEWRDVSGGATFKQAGLVWSKFVLGRISLYDKFLYALLIGLSSIPFLLGLLMTVRVRRELVFFWIWLVIPLLTGFLISFWIPVFNYFRLTFVLGAFYILVAAGILSIRKIFIAKILIACILIIHALGIGIYFFDKNQQREDWIGAINFIRGESRGGEVSVFEFSQPPAPYRFYEKNIIGIGATDDVSANYKQTIDKVDQIITDRNRIFYFEYLRDLSDPENFVLKRLNEKNFKEVKAKSFVGVGKVSILETQN